VIIAYAPLGSAGAETPAPHVPPVSPAAKQLVAERERMVRTQIAAATDYRIPVQSKAVLAAMRSIPRHVFVPLDVRNKAYDDTPLPVGHGQTISQPYIVAVMTDLLRLSPSAKVLEIGTGSGYQAAVLSHLTPHVYTIEIIEPLATLAAETLEKHGYGAVNVLHADGYHGWKSESPFDAIIVTCAAGHLPPPLWEQLKPGGRIVIPIGGAFSVQRLVVIEKTPDGKRQSETVMDVRFVPMTGRTKE
jgi:protein-L-isoaspartate(D-aspartate) O-methyltransferase